MKKTVLHKLRSFVERYPMIASAYRDWRNQMEFERKRPQRTPYGFSFVGNHEMQSGSFESEEVSCIKQILNDVDVFMDIGAHHGYYSCLARMADIQTLSVEPLPQNLRYLVKNLVINGWDDTEVFPLGLGASPHLAEIYGQGTGASLQVGWADASPTFKTTIPITTLDNLLAGRFQSKKILIKIDVEGSEYSVLQGAQDTLSRKDTVIWMIEINLTEHYPTGTNPTFAQTFALLWQYGYQSFFVSNQRQQPISASDVNNWTKALPDQYSSRNYLFVSTENHIQLKESPSEH